MSAPEFPMRITGLSDRDAEKAAADLVTALTKVDPSIRIDRHPDNAQAMDLGATLVIILGSGSAIAIANGIKNWMGRWRGASLTIIDGNRKLEVSNVSGAEASEIARWFAIGS